ncbi:hypothetical protein OAN96_00390 [Candidatus Gracilibacteria bacterium]|nr:hypothetical protein [Candidatus Gracilibacteria bacterium]
MRKILLSIITIILACLAIQNSFAEIINIPYSPDIEDVSVEYKGGFGGSIVESINSVGFSILNTLKIILSGVLLIYLVYIGVQMIISLGEDGEDLSAAKRQIGYTLLALVFINIPGTLYDTFSNPGSRTVGDLAGTWNDSGISDNIFVNSPALINTVSAIVGFFQTLIFSVAVIMIIISGIRLLTAGADEEQRKNSVQKVIWSVVALLFVGFIELWIQVAIGGNITGENGVSTIFSNIINIALFFAAPVALLFMTFAGYYYITSNGDEERVKKAKNIIIYTVIATLLLLAIFTFLVDLATLFN